MQSPDQGAERGIEPPFDGLQFDLSLILPIDV
jgi:hypothetical protein